MGSWFYWPNLRLVVVFLAQIPPETGDVPPHLRHLHHSLHVLDRQSQRTRSTDADCRLYRALAASRSLGEGEVDFLPFQEPFRAKKLRVWAKSRFLGRILVFATH